MQVTYGTTPVTVPPTALNTEITTYVWPGFLGEFVHRTQEFNAWALVGLDMWVPRPDIVAPPLTCIGVDTATVKRFVLSESEWTLYDTVTPLWRQLCQPSP
jgi:hypothetical protein